MPTLTIPFEALNRMREIFASYRKRQVESCCFWYGAKATATVTTIVVPEQVNRFGNFHVTGDAIARASAATRPLGLVALAQVHTHPGSNVDHSFYDDENVISRRVLSLVIPDYGSIVEPWPTGVGVHEFLEEDWQRLSDIDASERIKLFEGSLRVIDLR